MITFRRALMALVSVAISFSFASGQKPPSGKAVPPGTDSQVGKWQCLAKAEATESLKFYLAPLNEDGKLSGKIRTPQGSFTITGGTFTQGNLLLTVKTVEGVMGKLSGTVKGNKLTGDWSLDNDMSGTFECYRVEKAPVNAGGGR